MTARTCPVPGCGAGLRPGHLMCRPCWRNVPRKLQIAVNHSWTAFRSGRGEFATFGARRKSYDDACSAAIAAAEVAR